MQPTVLILVQNLSVPFDRRVWNEATSLGDYGYRIFVICPRTEMNPSRREEINGIKIIRFDPRIEGKSAGGLIVEYLISILNFSILTFNLSLRNRIDIVHICNPPDLLFIPALIAKVLRKSKIIFDQHDLCPEVVLSKGFSTFSVYHKLTLFLERVTYAVSSAVISTNQSYKKVAISRGAVNPQQVMVVRSGPKLEFGMKFDKPISNAKECRKLIYLGTMGLQEGVDVLIEMVELLVASQNGKYSDLVLNLVGKGPEFENIKSLVKSKGLQENILLHGRISDDELKALLLSSDIALNSDVPSILNDLSTMNKIIEYMAYGLPIIQFRAVEGSFTAESSSIYLEEYSPTAFMSAVVDLIENKDQREQMSKFGFERFRRDLSWESQVPNLVKIYNQVLQDM